MGKPCSAEGCYRRRWGGGFCQNHQRLREKKKPRGILADTKRERISQYDFGFDNQLNVFWYCWEREKDHRGNIYCKYTGEKLNGFKNTPIIMNCFAHILPKKNYTYWKLNPINIEVVHPEFHRIVDQGTFKERSSHPEWKWDEWDSKVLEMKEKYQQFKNENLLA